MENKKIQKVFWSGGFDSTYVVLHYLQQGIDVQPYYSNVHLFYQKKELETQERIRKVVSGISSLSGKIFPTKVFEFPYEIDDLPEDYKESYWQIWKEPGHYQHIRLAYYADMHNLSNFSMGIMVGVLKWDKNHLPFLYDLWVRRGKLKVNDNGEGYFTKEDCDPVVWKAFGCGVYPLVNIDRVEMYHNYLRNGWESVLKNVRFCYAGIDNYLCGCCLPCQSRIEDGVLSWYDKDVMRRVLVWRYLKEHKEIIDGIPAEKLFRSYCVDKEKYNRHLIVGSKYLQNKYAQYFERLLKKVRIPDRWIREKKKFISL